MTRQHEHIKFSCRLLDGVQSLQSTRGAIIDSVRFHLLLELNAIRRSSMQEVCGLLFSSPSEELRVSSTYKLR